MTDGIRHRHEFQGQALVHAHEDGSRPHGYYGHPGDGTAPRPELEVYAYPVRYMVTAWPQGGETGNTRTWSLYVDYMGRGGWAANQGTSPQQFLDASGEWRWHSELTSREEYCFPLEQALQLAREALPKLSIMGMTAADIIRKEKGNG